MRKSKSLKNSTFASNPGNVTLNPVIWFYHNFRKLVFLSFLFWFSVFLVVEISAWYIILAALFFVINLFHWIGKKDHFKRGDSNGGIVVSVDPKLVAVTTDLTKGNGRFPVVKIIFCDTLRRVKVGDKIPTVALYSASANDELPHWIDFNPIPLSYATISKKTIARAMESYDSEQWDAIENRLKEIKKPYKIGLYKSEVQTSDWKTYTDPL